MKLQVIAVLLLAAVVTLPSEARRGNKPKCRKTTYRLSDGDTVEFEDSYNNRQPKKCMHKFIGNGMLYFDLTCDEFDFQRSRGCRKNHMAIEGEKVCGNTSPDGGTDEPVNGIRIRTKGRNYSFRCKVSAHSGDGGGSGTKPTVPTVPTVPTEPTVAPPAGECKCAKYTASRLRIVGGTTTGVGEIPWMAALLSTRGGQQECGGTLVSPYWVLTAHHCVPKGKPGKTKVTLGDHDVTKPDGETTYNVQKIVPYSASTNFDLDDMALLKLDRKVTITDKIRPACLPFKYASDNLAGKYVWITGWGSMSTVNAQTTPAKLQKVYTEVVSNQRCQQIYGEPGLIKDSHICLGELGKSACSGDSGGPAVYVDPATSHAYVVGVTSMGDDHCNSGNKFAPGIFARVTSYLTWIKNTIQGDGMCEL